MSYGSASFEFPFEFDPDIEFGTFGYRTEVNNEGQAAAPVLIKVRGTGIENPRITNLRTGQFVMITRPLPTDSVLEIDTSFWHRRIELIGPDGAVENAYGYIDYDSDFFQLLPGVNAIDYSSDTGNETASVEILWYDHYAGV